MGESTDTTQGAAPSEILEMDHIFDALHHPRRRYLLYSLDADAKRSLWEIARRIAAWEGDVPEEAVTDDTVEGVYVSLYHNHVPKLVGKDIITFSETEETIETASNAEEVMVVLREIGGCEDSAQEDHATEDHDEGYT